MKKNLLLIAFIVKCGLSFSQEAAGTTEKVSPATVFAGSADAYYKYDFSSVPEGYTSFTNTDNSFELGMVSLEASHSWKKAAVFVDLGFGSRAQNYSYNDTPYTFMIKQLTFSYGITDDLQIVGGAFGTHIGYELLDAVDNKNYSMSYAFSYGPFYNTGVKAIYKKDRFGVMLGIANPTDFKSAIDAGTNQKIFIGQISYTAETGSVFFNVSSGSSDPLLGKDKTQFDIVASKQLGVNFSLGFNGTFVKVTGDNELDGDWFSLVGYANYNFKPALSLAYRIEYFDATSSDYNNISSYANTGLGPLAGSSVFANTISLNYKVGNLTIIPEIRVDAASENVFVDTDFNLRGTNAYALLATTYSF